VITADANLQTSAPTQSRKHDLEQTAAIAGTAVVATWLILATFNAGPLWRDEINSINLAQMPSLKEFWQNLPFESFPPFWLWLMRGLSFVGMASSDAGIRMIGLLVGLAFLGSLWLCARWTAGRPPILSLALLGSLPAIVSTVSANRAYGLAMCLLMLTFGTIWRMVELPTKSRIIWAAVVSLLFVHCVYYDVVFLGAILAGAALVVARRKAWKMLATLVAIGVVAGLSLAIYLPVIHTTAVYTQMVQLPFFSIAIIWEKFCEAVSLQSSAHYGPSGGPEVWLWLLLLTAGVMLAVSSQFRQARVANATTESSRADLALFCGTVLFCGVVGYFLFLLRLRFPTQPWYYMGVLSLCAISLEGVFSAAWPGLRHTAVELRSGRSTGLLSPALSSKGGEVENTAGSLDKWSGLVRIAFLAAMMIWSVRPMWEEGHTRRTNVDVIAAVLENQAASDDLIIVQSAWEGVTFDRYYHGKARWITVPPLESHKVHRTDLMWTELNERDAMAPVLNGISETLRSGGRVWVAGAIPIVEKLPPDPSLPPHPKTGWYLAPYYRYWTAQLSAHLLASALQTRIMQVTLPVPVNARENLPLQQFSGYRTNSEQSKSQQPASK